MQGWPKRGSVTSLLELAQVASKNITQVVYLHARLTVSGAVEDFLVKTVQNTWEEIKSTENYKKKEDPIFTEIVVICKVILCRKYINILVTRVNDIKYLTKIKKVVCDLQFNSIYFMQYIDVVSLELES